jgi:hypothetical protein
MVDTMPDQNEAEVMKLLIVRELVRANAEIIKATGFEPFDIGTEMMAQGMVMVLPAITIEQAREFTMQFWNDFRADYQKRLVEAGAVPLHKPANDDARNGASI